MSALETLLPRRCEACGCRGETMCAPCIGDLPWHLQSIPALDAVDNPWAAFRHAPPVQAQIHALKYRAGLRHAHRLGGLMAQRLARRAEPLPRLLIPVPLHAARLRRRGYNQSRELARALVQTLCIELDVHAARRIRATEDQIGKTAAERRRNVRGAFAVSRPLDGLHIALLDDVMTTGATLSELARVCREAGAAKIEAWALARAPLKN